MQLAKDGDRRHCDEQNLYCYDCSWSARPPAHADDTGRSGQIIRMHVHRGADHDDHQQNPDRRDPTRKSAPHEL
jgi:hypothetical protein